MGYLDNSSVIVDAILTKKGRELLAKGNNQFNITNSHYQMMRLITLFTIQHIHLVQITME